MEDSLRRSLIDEKGRGEGMYMLIGGDISHLSSTYNAPGTP